MSDEQFSFFYVLGIVVQEGLPTVRRGSKLEQIVGQGHILRAGRLLCKESMEVLKNKHKGVKTRIAKIRINGVPLCTECQEEYKKVFSSAWASWVNGLPKSG